LVGITIQLKIHHSQQTFIPYFDVSISSRDLHQKKLVLSSSESCVTMIFIVKVVGVGTALGLGGHASLRPTGRRVNHSLVGGLAVCRCWAVGYSRDRLTS